MRISRIPKIKGYRIFRDFAWPGDLPAFSQFNVIYGWNWSGKTTLSSLFESLQKKSAVTEGQVEFELDIGSKLAGNEIPSANVPSVRVFNRNFVAKTFEAIQMNRNLEPIYFLGEESIEKQKQAEALKGDLEKARDAVSKAQVNKRNADSDLDNYCIEKGRLIKEALLGSSDHANYDKRGFREAIKRLKNMSPQPNPLSDEEKDVLRKQKELQPKPDISKLTVTIPDLGQLCAKTEEILKRSVVSRVMDELVSDPEVGKWVHTGLSLHKGERQTNKCRFCDNNISPERLAQLEAHFNDAFISFMREISQVITDLETSKKELESVVFPDESRFYDHLVLEARPCVKSAKTAIKVMAASLNILESALERKKHNPFEQFVFDEGGFVDSSADVSSAVNALNAVIEKHVTMTSNFGNEIRNAYIALEQDYVIEFMPGFEALNCAVTNAETMLTSISGKPRELEEKIFNIERDIKEHRRPAEELNQKLKAYLGHGELTFEVKDTGYALSRNGNPALDLSEGERTAIAFLYFLKSLKDKSFDLSTGIVVIDDPVSSLDANSLFSAFGYMKERTKACHQLFILTHNFAFFRQVKNWFHNVPKEQKKRPTRFYLLQAEYKDNERYSRLLPIDPLLEEFETEYHYLFKQVHIVANDDAPIEKFECYYGMPNIARRLLETFLAYRLPGLKTDKLHAKFDAFDFDSAKKTSILRFLNTYSHAAGISGPEHDPSVLAETKEVMKLILEMIETMDPSHYKGMIDVVASKEEAE